MTMGEDSHADIVIDETDCLASAVYDPPKPIIVLILAVRVLL